MCWYFYQGNDKQTHVTLKGHYFYTIEQCQISLKEPYRPYTSRILHRVPKLDFSKGKSGGCSFEGGHLLQILTLRRGTNSKRGAYSKLGGNSSIYSKM